jgi:hypothetical protein
VWLDGLGRVDGALTEVAGALREGPRVRAISAELVRGDAARAEACTLR